MAKIIFSCVGVLVVAFLLVGLGMRIESRHNKKAWEKYYEGAGLAANAAGQRARNRQGAPR